MNDFLNEFYKENLDLYNNSELIKNFKPTYDVYGKLFNEFANIKKENDMGIKVKNFYETTDGEVFEELKDAEKHEANCKKFLRNEVQSKLDYIEKLMQEKNITETYWIESDGCVELKVYFS